MHEKHQHVGFNNSKKSDPEGTHRTIFTRDEHDESRQTKRTKDKGHIGQKNKRCNLLHQLNYVRTPAVRVSSLINSENKKVGVTVACRTVFTSELWQNVRIERLCLAQIPRTPVGREVGPLGSQWVDTERSCSLRQPPRWCCTIMKPIWFVDRDSNQNALREVHASQPTPPQWCVAFKLLHSTRHPQSSRFTH